MFRFETEVDKERLSLLGERLEAANAQRSSAMRALAASAHRDEVPLQVWVVEEGTGQLAAGLTGRTWARWLHVDLLWVDSRHRGAGLGSQLLAAAEREARVGRGCSWSRLETWDFQAPGFYRKHGYEIVGRVPDYPPGVTEYLLAKHLG
ncbi:GNAT family N-acetyltransferase [Streptomyces sp. NPDC087659]|uniref:GNAT family N-acetyltransferase n=1 Tax=unclassified Streptomyces TaxID=2593676 RepID=UPI0030144D04